MPEILFITNEQSLLEIIDQLKALVDARIDIVNDFSQGLKVIFFRQPAVVFIQSELGGITGEKVASQVRALLDDEPIKLVLLRKEMKEWQVADSNFNGSIDITLSPPELIRQLQQQVYDALSTAQGMTAVAEETPQNDTDVVELSVDLLKPGDAYTIDSLADIFPAHLPEDWGTPLPDLEPNALTAVETVEPAIETIQHGEEFIFDDMSDIPGDARAISTLLSETGQLQEPSWIYSHLGLEPEGDNERSECADRSDDQKLLSHLSGGISNETLSEMEFHKPAPSGSTATMESGTCPQPAPPFIDHPEILGVNNSSLAVNAGHSEGSSDLDEQALPLSSATQKESPPVFGGSTSIPTRIGPEHFDTHSPGATFADDIPFREDFGKKSALKIKILIGTLILIISLAALYVARDLLAVPEQDPLSIAPPSAPLSVPLRDLPAFIPGVTPDGAYAAAHPGWERREADGLEYLIYRENGRIKAIQVIAGTQGVISVPFLKTCIRVATGLADAENWVREKKEDILVEKGSLRDKGELAVYRKMPENDIRGFVLTFY
jgi:CheY-like chemotaxis protein